MINNETEKGNLDKILILSFYGFFLSQFQNMTLLIILLNFNLISKLLTYFNKMLTIMFISLRFVYKATLWL